jgi:GT2 family glycosyltransferase
MVSVVIPTLDRDEPLVTTLEYFLNCEEYQPFEIIVIDQSERHDQKASEFLEKAARRIQYVRVRYKSVTRAKNQGAQLARGAIIVFVDDDTQPFKGFISAHVSGYTEESVWMVTGPVLNPGQGLRDRNDLGKNRVKRLLEGDEACFEANFDYMPCSWAPGGNFSVRKAAIDLIGGFDEQFPGVAVGEDSEFCHRIKLAGGKISYKAAAALNHCPPAGGGHRHLPTLEYVKTYADSVNYFCRKIEANWPKRFAANWDVYRRFVLTRRNLTNPSPRQLAAFHCAFIRGVMAGLGRARTR